ncbi:hypothetical protein [Mucilaginibacter sp.]|uniref:hypothetical protein n=1 Tax=Mucilaginibacter sp. TaxID=1882438 RepID=UPI0032669741
MNKYYLVFILAFFCACKKQLSHYKEIDRDYYVSAEVSNSKDGSLDTLYTFLDPKNLSTALKVGFYKNGFMNGTWTYNDNTGIKEIKWAHYYDKHLKFETNVFPFVDSVKYKNNVSKFLFKKGEGSIILSVSLNGPIKDSLPQKKYDIIAKNELLLIGAKVKFYNSKDISNEGRKLHLVNSMIILPNGKIRYIYAMFTYTIGGEFIEISCNSNIDNLFYAKELFYAAVTNFKIKKNFLYPIPVRK